MRFLTGHTKEVRAAAYLPDGRLVSVSGDKTARLWDPLAGTSEVIHKAKGPLYALAVSPDGRTVAMSGRHPTPGTPVALYDAERGLVSRTLTHLFHRLGYQVDAAGEPAGQPEPAAGAIWSLSFSSDGRYLAAAGRRPGGGNVPNGAGGATWALRTETGLSSLPGPNVYSVQYSPDTPILAITRRRVVLFYDHPQPMYREIEPIDPRIFVYPVQCDWAPAVEFLPADGRAGIAAGSYVHLVDPSGNRKPVKVKSESRTVTALAPTPDGRSLLVGGKPGRVEVFDLAGPKPTRRTAFDFDVGGVYGLAVAPDGLTFAVAADKGLLVCDMEAA